MRDEQEIRELLIDNTIRLVAEGGFENATTKAIAYSGNKFSGPKMNEAYIYRIFGSKEHLYEVAFELLDNELVFVLRKSIRFYKASVGAEQEQLYELFLHVWQFILNNEVCCRYYIRYYHSIYFKGTSLANHNRNFDEVVAEFAPLFREEADVRSILHHVLITLLNFAVRVYNRDLKDNDTARLQMFNMLYCSMESYFNDEAKY